MRLLVIRVQGVIRHEQQCVKQQGESRSSANLSDVLERLAQMRPVEPVLVRWHASFVLCSSSEQECDHKMTRTCSDHWIDWHVTLARALSRQSCADRQRQHRLHSPLPRKGWTTLGLGSWSLIAAASGNGRYDREAGLEKVHGMEVSIVPQD